MEEKILIGRRIIFSMLVLVLLGIITIVYALNTDPARAWTNYLLNSYYFLSISVGAAFFLALQYISQAGWSAGFKRIPEAIMLYLPVAAILFLFLFFGRHYLYHWTHADMVAADPILQRKEPYLNVPFAFIRMLLCFSLWILFIYLLRKSSLKEDQEGGMEQFTKSEFQSKLFIFVLAVTFSVFTVDWIMSIDAHWFSTLFALKNFVAAFYHGSAMIALVVIILRAKGYLSFMNEFHLHDFSRYIFMLAIVWGYFWFSQFALIWFGNIPEETIYYSVRWKEDWQFLFYLDVFINWFVPFALLLPIKTSRNTLVVGFVCVLLIFGFWLDLYLQIAPETLGNRHIGLIEAGTFIGFAALFALIISLALGRANLVPVNHPYLDESQHHEF
jgi:hypothetical protein